ncbi:hypothetical protein AOLI_G00096250 [Acnodon oligacanthus]
MAVTLQVQGGVQARSVIKGGTSLMKAEGGKSHLAESGNTALLSSAPFIASQKDGLLSGQPAGRRWKKVRRMVLAAPEAPVAQTGSCPQRQMSAHTQDRNLSDLGLAAAESIRLQAQTPVSRQPAGAPACTAIWKPDTPHLLGK